MEYKRIRLLVFYLVFTRRTAKTIETTHFDEKFDKMPDLKEFCPYSSFCGLNASSVFPTSDISRPCCQSCSCDTECDLRGDCCFEQLDKYKRGKDSMVCRHTFALEQMENFGRFASIILPSQHYRMVHKCNFEHRKAETNDNTCIHNSSDIDGSFHPMHSPYTGRIYVNAYCAMCNNISAAVPWKTALICPQNAETTLSDFMAHFVSRKISVNYPGCLLYYIPPSNVSLESQTCYPNVIRKCKERNKYWDYCERFNATFIVQNAMFKQAYANVYCFLCNEGVTFSFGRLKCETSVPFGDKNPFAKLAPLTIMLKIPRETKQRPDSRKKMGEDCPLNSVMVKSFTKTCRRIKCPTGQLFINSRCDYYSSQWTGGPFAVVLRLSQLSKEALLPTSFFKDMSVKDKYDKQARWIKRKTLKDWVIKVMYHLSKDQLMVEYIIVKAVYPSDTVHPQVLQKSILRALSDKWEIVFAERSILFHVNLNEHFKFDLFWKDTLKTLGTNITDDYGYFPIPTVCHWREDTTYVNKYNLMLFPISNFVEEGINLNKGIFITKLFFCNQVELLPEEYENLVCSNIFFKVKNVTLNIFNRVSLSDENNPANMSNQKLFSRIYVCLQEFEQTNYVGVGVSFYISELFLMVYMATVVFK